MRRFQTTQSQMMAYSSWGSAAKFQPYHNPEPDDKQENDYLQNNNNFVYVLIPKERDQNRAMQTKKSSIHTRQNMQLVQQKNKIIRYSNVHHKDQPCREMAMGISRASSALNNYQIRKQEILQPIISSIKNSQPLKPQSIKKLRQSKTQPKIKYFTLKSQNNKQCETHLTSIASRKTSIKSSKGHTLKAQLSNKLFKDENSQQKQHRYDYISTQCSSKLKKKCLQDNLNVMASLVRKKIKYLDKKQMMIYLRKLLDRKSGK